VVLRRMLRRGALRPRVAISSEIIPSGADRRRAPGVDGPGRLRRRQRRHGVLARVAAKERSGRARSGPAGRAAGSSSRSAVRPGRSGAPTTPSARLAPSPGPNCSERSRHWGNERPRRPQPEVPVGISRSSARLSKVLGQDSKRCRRRQLTSRLGQARVPRGDVGHSDSWSDAMNRLVRATFLVGVVATMSAVTSMGASATSGAMPRSLS